MIDNNSRRFAVPHGWRVRYDYHDKPRGMSAIVLDPTGRVRSVGFAKFNPHDASFKAATGGSIALGRALAKLPSHLTRPFQTGRITRRQEPLTDDEIIDALAGPPTERRSLADELF